MNYTGEAADQVVRISIQGAEVVLKLTGSAAERVTAFLYAVIKDQQKTMGKTRLVSMLKSGKELSVFTVKTEDLSAFTAEARRYGVLFCSLKDKTSKETGTLDIMVYKEDASKINRIVERLSLATVEKEGDENPTITRTKRRSRSERISQDRETAGAGSADPTRDQKKSIRKTIEEIKAQRRADKSGASHVKEKSQAVERIAKERAARARE